MNKEKLGKLERYLSNMQQRLESNVPEKHKNHPETYKRFLMNEISTVKAQIEQMRLEGVSK